MFYFIFIALTVQFLAQGALASDLQEAAKSGDLTRVEELVNEANINKVSPDGGNNALIFAAKNGHEEVVNRLLEVPGVQVNQPDRDGNTALMRAAQKNHLAIVATLLDDPRVLPNTENKDGMTAFTHAIRGNAFEVTRMFLNDPRINVMQLDKAGDPPIAYALPGMPVFFLLLNHQKTIVSNKNFSLVVKVADHGSKLHQTVLEKRFDEFTLAELIQARKKFLTNDMYMTMSFFERGKLKLWGRLEKYDYFSGEEEAKLQLKNFNQAIQQKENDLKVRKVVRTCLEDQVTPSIPKVLVDIIVAYTGR